MSTILISGGTGLVGRRLCKLLRDKGHVVKILTRNKSNNSNFVHWNVEKGFIEDDALKDVDTIIHLAGEGIADGRWTEERKKKIENSRIKSTQLLYNELSKNNHKVKCFISASAIGYYSERRDEIMQEDSSPANDFLGRTTVRWENEVSKINQLNIRTIILRTGIVLSLEGGALKSMITPFYYGLGSALGNGKQWMSWIHIDDLCNMYLYAIENEGLDGIYNAVAPNPVTNNEFSKTLAQNLRRPYWAPNIPAWFIKLLFGEMSIVILASTKVDSSKIENTEFHFSYKFLKEALENIIQKDK